MARHLATVGLLGGAFCALWSVGETLVGWYLMEPPSVKTPADQLYCLARQLYIAPWFEACERFVEADGGSNLE